MKGKFTPDVKVRMTPTQMKALAPLFKMVIAHPMKYSIIGQVSEGLGLFALMTPEQLIERAEAMKLEREAEVDA